MKRNHLLYIGLGLAFLLWALNEVALVFYLYWTVGWYDYMTHFLGGLTLGVLACWFFNIKGGSISKFVLIFVTVFILGCVWEVFEYVNGLTNSTEGYVLDTFHDLLMDSVGAVVAFWIVSGQRKESL